MDASRASLHRLRRGTPEAAAECIPLRAGPLRLLYCDGDLRYLELGGVEVIRRIYPMVRDGQWNTFPVQLRSASHDIGDTSFTIRYEGTHRGISDDGRDLHMELCMLLTGAADGTLRVMLEGHSRSRFPANRIGLCILYPTPACLGHRVRIDHIDGSVEEGRFPDLVSPELPFTDIAALRSEPLPGVAVTLRLTGAVFEMEDQRNYGDASFKVFSTPLRYPKPVEIAIGQRIEQSLELTLAGALPAPRPSPPVVTLRLNACPGTPARPNILPSVGVNVSGEVWSESQLDMMRMLAPAHLHVDCALGDADWRARLARAIGQALQLACGLEVGLLFASVEGSTAELAALAEWRPSALPSPSSILVYARGGPAGPSLLAAVRQWLGQPAGITLGLGSWLNFCLLNEARPTAPFPDLIAFASNPQGHSADDATVMENHAAAADAVRSTRAFAPDCAIAIAPLRFMPRADEAANHPRRAYDPRLSGLFGAAWACGALGALAQAGVNQVSCFAAVAADGLMPALAQDAIRVHPIFHLLADCCAMAGGQVLPVIVDQPLRIAALAVARQAQRRLLIANLSDHISQVAVGGLDGAWHLLVLDETTAPQAMRDPLAWRQAGGDPWSSGAVLTLAPYAIARLDQR